MSNPEIRRSYAGAAVAAVLTAGLGGATTDLTISCDDLSGWPTGADGPFYACINRTFATEETVLCESRVGNTLYVFDDGITNGRGQDDGPIFSHNPNETIEHIITKADIDEANRHTSSTSGVHGANGDIVGTDDLNAAVSAAVGDATDSLSAQIADRVEYHYGTSAPTYSGTPGSQVWWDTNYSPPRAKINNGSAWVTFSGASVPTVDEGSSTGWTFSTLTNPDGDGKNYRLAVANASSGVLAVTNAGVARVLAVGGRGGYGAYDGSLGGYFGTGYGGGGGVVDTSAYLPAGSLAYSVGANGADAAGVGRNGQSGGSTRIDKIVAPGGPGGGLTANPASLGSNANGSYDASGLSGGVAGGGGAGSAASGSTGGNGIGSNISGSTVTYGGGKGASDGSGAANQSHLAVRWEI